MPHIENIFNQIYLNLNSKSTKIGDSNIDSKIEFGTFESIEEEVHYVLPLALSCLTYKTKSCSPSMMLHQIASLVISRILGQECVFEHESSYSPDIFIPSLNIYIDITSANTRRKLEKMPKHTKNIAINKYMLLKNIDEIKDIIEYSENNDQHNMQFIYDHVIRQSNKVKREIPYSVKLLNFFQTKVDSKNRSMREHSDILSDIIKSKIVGFEKKDIKTSKKKCLSKFLLELSKRCLSYKSSKENKVFIFSSKYQERYNDLHEVLIEPINIIERVTNEGGIIKYSNEGIRIIDDLFSLTKREQVPIPYEFYADALGYASLKIDNNRKRVLSVNNLLDTYTEQRSIMNIINRAEKRLRCSVTGKSSYLVADSTLYQPTHLCTPTYLTDRAERLNLNSLKCSRVNIDPDHLKILTEMSCLDLVNILETSRDYQELRFRHRVANTSFIVRKANITFTVNHWFDHSKRARCVIKGEMFDKDKGIMIVSYIDDDKLYRTEKWRLPDIENYSVAHHRLIAMCISIKKLNLSNYQTNQIIMLYARLLAENSWGNSKFLKPYRYWVNGFIVDSPYLPKQTDKLIKALSECNLKFSWFLMQAFLTKELADLKPNRSPMFSLEWKDIGYECFLLNICPNRTYGHSKHLFDVCKELYDEIKLFENNKEGAYNIIQHFENIIDSNNLYDSYREHLDLIDNYAKQTDIRFTASPASVLMLLSECDKVRFSYRSIQEVCPHISELMTARASYNTSKGDNSTALESIASLVSEFKSSSTSHIAIKLLNTRVPDLFMWLFDKDQVGGNREISVLTGEFRILQSITERFARTICKHIDFEYLDKEHKIKDLSRDFEFCINNLKPIFLTADQTRWGPNFNTLIFGLTTLMFSDKTTEYYIPTLVNLISQYKGFEVPIEYDNLYENINCNYSLPCIVSESHMGQGIFHTNSSMYHALVIKTILRFKNELFMQSHDVKRTITLYSKAFVTSDDLCIMECVIKPDKEQEKEILREVDNVFEYIDYISNEFYNANSIFYEGIQDVLVYFGIKTSDYKNWSSNKSCEFNSIFLSSEGLGSNDLKFLYSLVEPQTTGNFIQDYRNVLDSYYSASNSMCSESSMRSIVYTNYLKFCRHWKLNVEITGLPSINTIKSGLMPWISTNEHKTETKSTLKFKLRDVKNEYIKFIDNDISNQICLLRYEDMERTRERENYRSCITYSTATEIINYSEYFARMDAVGESYSSFIRECNNDINHASAILRSDEHQLTSVIIEKESHGNLIEVLNTKKSVSIGDNIYSILSALNGHPKTISRNSSQDKIILHLMRRYHTFEYMNNEFESLKGLPLSEQIIKLRELDENKLSKGGSNLYIFNKNRERIKYIQQVQIAPIVNQSVPSDILNLSYNDIDYSLNYSQNTAYVFTIEKTINGFIYCKRQNGYKTCIYRDMHDFTLFKPNIEDIILYVTDNIYEQEEKYNQDIDVYLNIKCIKKIIKEENKEEEVNIMNFSLDEFDNINLDNLKIS